MKKLLLAPLAMLALALGLLAPSASNAATHTWNDGFHDEDTVIDCITGQPSTGVSANVSWSSPTGAVPRIGEKFYLRGYIGLVSLPCSGKVAVLPEIMVPAGIDFVDEDMVWDLTRAGEQQQLGTDPLAFDHGQNGGILMGNADYTPFTLRQGDVLEFQFPVKATRELKGPATQQPQCQSRLDGDAPCPINQAGDHLQIAFTVTGHGGDKYYVTPFVGLFASALSPTPTPTSGPTPTPTSGPTSGPTSSPTSNPTASPTSNPTSQSGPGSAKAASATAASWKLVSGRRGKATVTVKSTGVPTGSVVIRDKGRTIARATMRPTDGGRVVIRLPRLAKGKHRLVAAYAGSASTLPSTSPQRKVTLR